MKSIKTFVFFFLFLLVALLPLNASAQLFGSDDKNWNKVFIGLKKINSRLVKIENSEMVDLKNQLEYLLRQIEELKQSLPQLQGSVELNKSETLSNLSKIKTQLINLEGEVKNQLLAKIDKQSNILNRFQKDQTRLKKGLAHDIEQFEKINKENFQNFASTNKSTLEIVVKRLAALDETTKKSFEDIRGLFITDVIPAMAKENLDNRKAILEDLSRSRVTNEKGLVNLSNKNKILIGILGENLKQGAETKEQIASISETLGVFGKGFIAAQEFDQLVDGKISKLIESSAQLTVNTNKLEESVLGELKQSTQKEDSNQDKINLANEKLSRLIEILKKMAMEQDKLNQLVKSQAAMSKAQAGLMENQKSIKKALADLRNKANVNISRNEDIKKALGKNEKDKSGISSKSQIKKKNQ
jgi:ABC-type transporter Mla subunit MlaD